MEDENKRINFIQLITILMIIGDRELWNIILFDIAQQLGHIEDKK